MGIRFLVLALPALFSLAGFGCFGPVYQEGVVCGPDETCPPGQECVSGTCHTPGADAALNRPDADPTIIDGGTIDATLCEGVTCDDEIGCTDDQCNEADGGCTYTPNHALCTDTEAPFCDPELDCISKSCDDSGGCDDGAFCNGAEWCDFSGGGSSGECRPGVAPDCADSVACTDDSCSAALNGCVNAANDGHCDNGAFCDGVEVCHVSDDCVDGPDPTEDDGIDCTVESCNETFDRIDHTPTTVQLTANKSGSGSGLVVSSPLGIDCGGACTATFDCQESVTLEAYTGPGDGFAGWSGGGCTGVDECELVLDSDLSVTAIYSAANYMFRTAATFQGNLGGLLGADAKCQAEAIDAGLSGTYRAWLSAATIDAKDRFIGARGWVRTDDRAFLDDPADPMGIYYAPKLDENGISGDVNCFTATGNSGAYYNNFDLADCNGWSSNAAADEVLTGRSTGGAYRFTSYLFGDCSELLHLYCLGTDHNVAVRPIPVSGRYAFISGNWPVGGGRSAADAHCQSEADAVGLPGSYLALLATTTSSPASRFDAGSGSLRWVRVDGIQLAATAAGMFGGEWDAALTVMANGDYRAGSTVWTGVESNLAAVSTLTCGDWTTTTGSGRGGSAGQTGSGAYRGNSISCSTAWAGLYCLQE